MQGAGLVFRAVRSGLDTLFSIDARPLLLAFAVCAGAAFYFSLPDEPDLTTLCSICGALLILLMAIRHWSPVDWPVTALTILFGFSLGAAAGSMRAHTVAAPAVIEAAGPAMVEGWVRDVEPGKRGVRLLIQTHSVAGMSPEEVPHFVRLTHTSRLEVAPGRFVRCWAMLRPPPGPAMPGEYDFRRQAWFEQLGAVGFVQGRCRGGALGGPSDAMGQAVLSLGSARRNLALHVTEAAGERAGGFAAALVSGDRSFMRAEDADALRNTGLAHLLAISGLHLSIVGGLVFLLSKRLLILIEPLALRIPAQKPAAIIAFLACLAYLIISGSSVATQRAFIMAAIVFAAIVFDRSAISLRTFAIAMLAVVLLQPESVVTPGFQMSFAATGALIAAYEAWRNRRAASDKRLGPIGFSWASIVVTSIVAGFATMPYAMFHFDRAAPIGFAANLVAMPVVTFVSAPAAALAFVLAPFGLSDIGLRLFGYSLEMVLAIAHYFERFSYETGYSVHSMPLLALVLSSFGIAAAIATTGFARALTGGCFLVAALLVWNDSPRFLAHWSSSGEIFYATGGNDIERRRIVKGSGLSPLRFTEVPASACAGPICDISVSSGTIRLLSDEQARFCIYTGPPPPLTEGCNTNAALTWTWADVMEAGGLTAHIRKGQITLSARPPCGRRLWHPCKPDYGRVRD